MYDDGGCIDIPFQVSHLGHAGDCNISFYIFITNIFVLRCHKRQGKETRSTCLIISCTIYQNIFPLGISL